jgi:hypothetical protein
VSWNELSTYIGRELDLRHDTDGRVDVLVAGVGTGGTITGTARYLRERNPRLHMVAVQPASSPLLTGGAAGPHLQIGPSGGFLALVLDQTVHDEVVDITDQQAYATTRALARQEALLVGASSDAVVTVALQVAARPEWAGAARGRGAVRLRRETPVHAAVHRRSGARRARPRGAPRLTAAVLPQPLHTPEPRRAATEGGRRGHKRSVPDAGQARRRRADPASAEGLMLPGSRCPWLRDAPSRRA